MALSTNHDMTIRPAVETWFGLRSRRVKVHKSFLQHWRSMEPEQSTIICQSKAQTAKSQKKDANKRATTKTANQLQFPPQPALIAQTSEPIKAVEGLVDAGEHAGAQASEPSKVAEGLGAGAQTSKNSSACAQPGKSRHANMRLSNLNKNSLKRAADRLEESNNLIETKEEEQKAQNR
jgi:hypothetical protein